MTGKQVLLLIVALIAALLGGLFAYYVAPNLGIDTVVNMRDVAYAVGFGGVALLTAITAWSRRKRN